MFRTDDVTRRRTAGRSIWDDEHPQYKGKISIYDDSIFIADAALYLKATQPDLGIENPYQLTQEQFDAAVALLKKLAPNVGEWWVDYAKQIQSFANKDSVVGTTWPLQVTPADRCRQAAVDGDQAEGGHDGLVGHVDDRVERREPELHVPLDGSHDGPEDPGDGRGGLR